MDAFKRERELIRFLKSEDEHLQHDEPLSQSTETFPTISMGRLSGLHKEIDDNPFCLIQNYQSVLNVQRNFKDSLENSKNKKKTETFQGILSSAIDVIIHSIENLSFIVENDENESLTQKIKKLSAVLLFLVEKFVVEIETICSFENESSKNSKGQSKNYSFWPQKRKQLMTALRELLEASNYKVIKLLDCPNTDYTLLRCLTDSICAVMKNLKEDELPKDGIFSKDINLIFQILCCRSNEQDILLTRLIPLLSRGEGIAKIIANCICQASESNEHLISVKNVIFEAVVKAADFFRSKNLSDKGFPCFLMELAKQRPKECIRIIPLVKDELLDFESFSIRQAALHIIFEILKLDSESYNLDDGKKKDAFRESLLEDTLLNHTKDIKPAVRSKALELLTKLVQYHKLNIPETLLCLQLSEERLADSKITVRNAALKFLKAVVCAFPMGVQPEISNFYHAVVKHIGDLHLIYEAEMDKPTPLDLLKKITQKFRLSLKYGFSKFCVDKWRNSLTIRSIEEICTLIKEKLIAKKYWEACEIHHVALTLFSETEFNNAIRAPDEETLEMLHDYFDILDDSQVDDDSDLNSTLSECRESQKAADLWEMIVSSLSFGLLGIEINRWINRLLKLSSAIEQSSVGDVQSLFETLSDKGYILSVEVTGFLLEFLQKTLKPDTDEKVLAEKVNFFKNCYFDARISTVDVKIVRRLIQLVKTFYEDHKEVVRTIVLKLCQTEFVSSRVITMLWDAYTLREITNPSGRVIPVWKSQDSIYAILLLGISFQVDRKNIAAIITQRVLTPRVLERAKEDFEFAEAVFSAILIACSKDKEQEGIQFPPSSVLFSSTLMLITEAVKSAGNTIVARKFSTLVKKGIAIFLKLSLGDPVKDHIVMKLFPLISLLIDTVRGSCDQYRLIRYFILMTEILQGYIKFYEEIVIPELRKRKELKTKSKQPNTALTSESKTSLPGKSCSSTSSTNASVNSSMANEIGMMIGSVGFEKEVEEIKTLVENIFNKPGSAFSVFKRMTLSILNKWETIQDENLKVYSLASLFPIMSVNASEARSGVEILKKIWDGTDEVRIKCLIAKTIVPLYSKFSNEVETFTAKIIQVLQDASESGTQLKVTCLEVIDILTSLGFVRPRDILTPFTLCTVHKDPMIKEFSKNFLMEFAQDKNRKPAWINSIPETLSQIAEQSDRIHKSDSQSIIKFTMARVDAKHVPSVTDTILKRLKHKAQSGTKACHLLAIALQKLQHNDKSLKAMNDNFDCISDKLDDEVYNCFLTIISDFKAGITKTKSQKGSQSESSKIEAFEKRIKEARSHWSQANQIEKDARKGCEESSGSQEVDSNSNQSSENSSTSSTSLSEEIKKKVRKPTTKSKSVLGKRPSDDISDDSDSDDSEVTSPSKGIKLTKVQMDSDIDLDSD